MKPGLKLAWFLIQIQWKRVETVLALIQHINGIVYFNKTTSHSVAVRRRRTIMLKLKEYTHDNKI